ncbi:MAG: radical SAM protein [Defluviitaleaceae bacterium]|nr:radical SAM protein [Defluviitaleaceae bacterium]
MKVSSDLVVLNSAADPASLNIYNKFTHRLSVVHRAVFGYLTQCQDNGNFDNLYEDLSENQITTLLDSGVLINDDDVYLSKKFRHPIEFEAEKELRNVYIHLTMDCNLSCGYCYQKENLNTSTSMPVDKWLKILDSIKSAGATNLTVTGGEPFLYENLLDVVKHAKGLGFYISLLTNGTLMSPDSEVFAYVDTVICSLDTLDDSFRKGLDSKQVFENVVNVFNKYPDKIKVRTVVAKGYEDDAIVLGKKLADLGIPHMTGACSPSSLDDVDYVPDYDKYNLLDPECMSSGCGAGISIMAIDTVGNIYPCQVLIDPRMVITNVLLPDWLEIFNNSNVYKEIKTFNPYEDDGCVACDMVHLCMGACRAQSFKIYNDFNARPEILCDFYKKSSIKRMEAFK